MMHGKREETEVESPFLLEPSMRFVDGFQSIDYMGRLFIHPLPSALQAAAVRQSEPCAPPRAPRRVLQAPVSRRGTETTQVSSGSAPTAAGVQLVRWAPPTFGHLLFSADLQGVAKLWQCHPSGGPSGSPTSGKGKISSSHSSLIATFNAHNRPIKSLQVTSDASILTTGSTDGTITMWDVETGQCLHQMWCNEPSLYHELSRGQAGRGQRDGAVLPVVDHLHHPSDERHILLAAVDRKVLLYDVRTPSHQLSSSSSSITATGMTKGAAGAGDSSGYGGCASFKPLREYMGHMGTILHLSLLGSSGSKMLTTSEDKTLRTWDYAIPIQIKQFADAGMHAISHVMAHPYEKDVLAAQSLNNKVIVFQDEGGGRLRLWQHREFTGHKIAGTGCQLGFSRDGSMLSSGDIHGNLFLWKWSNGELVKKFMAHSEMLTSHVWHPIDGSRIVTAGWDGAIKEWT